MRSLITGGAGFVGSHLADHLVAAGHEVVLLDDLSTGRHANVAHLIQQRRAQLVLGSVLDGELVDDLVRRVDRVFHLAAAVGVELVVRKPLESLRTNILGSQTVIEKAHRHRKAVLVMSSSEIYGKNGSDRLGEDDDRVLGSPLRTRWAYSEAKAIGEVLAYVYWREKGLPTVTVRLFNTVGPRQIAAHGMVIPRFVDQAVRGEPLTVYGDGMQRRCFVHVSDVVPTLARLLDEPSAHGRVFNLGGGEEIAIAALARRVVRLAGSSSTIRHVPYEQAYEEGFEDMPRRVPDTTRIRELLGWRPRLGLDAIITSVLVEQRG